MIDFFKALWRYIMFSGLRSSGGRGRLSSNVDKKLKVVSGLLSEVEILI